MAPFDLSGLVRLCHHRWTIPLVAVCGPDRGARFAVIQKRLQVARPTLQRAIAAADQAALLMRNPGYGHPLRPEYLLTPFGEALAPSCADVWRRVQALDGPELAARKWTLPVLVALRTHGPAFADLRGALDEATPRALSRALDHLVEAAWVERTVRESHPPRPFYRVTPKARALTRAAERLAKAVL